MKITPKHTYAAFLLNALTIIITIIITAFNMNGVTISELTYQTLSYISEIALLYTLLYLLFAFKFYDSKKRFAGFGLNILFTATLFFLMPIIPGLIKTRWGVVFAIFVVLLFINICYLAVISLKLTYRPLAVAFFLFFLSLIIVIILPMIAPLVMIYLERSPDSYLSIMHFLTFMPPLLRFLVLYQINMGLKQPKRDDIEVMPVNYERPETT